MRTVLLGILPKNRTVVFIAKHWNVRIITSPLVIAERGSNYSELVNIINIYRYQKHVPIEC